MDELSLIQESSLPSEANNQPSDQVASVVRAGDALDSKDGRMFRPAPRRAPAMGNQFVHSVHFHLS